MNNLFVPKYCIQHLNQNLYMVSCFTKNASDRRIRYNLIECIQNNGSDSLSQPLTELEWFLHHTHTMPVIEGSELFKICAKSPSIANDSNKASEPFSAVMVLEKLHKLYLIVCRNCYKQFYMYM